MDMAGQCDMRATFRQLPGDCSSILQMQNLAAAHPRRGPGPEKEWMMEADDLNRAGGFVYAEFVANPREGYIGDFPVCEPVLPF